MLSGALVRLWVGEADYNTGIIPLAILHNQHLVGGEKVTRPCFWIVSLLAISNLYHSRRTFTFLIQPDLHVDFLFVFLNEC